MGKRKKGEYAPNLIELQRTFKATIYPPSKQTWTERTKKYISSLTAACGRSTRKLATSIRMRWKSWTSKPGRSATSEAAHESDLSRVTSPTSERKKLIERARRRKEQKFRKRKRCHVMDKICRTESEAKWRAKSVKVWLRAYKCEFCGSWHLTHKRNKLTMH